MDDKESQTDLPERIWAIHSTPWEPRFLRYINSARQSIKIVCPFIKLRSIRLLLAALPAENAQPIPVEIVTRLNTQDCRNRVHDASALQLLLTNPMQSRCDVRVMIDNTVHAKLYIIDDSTSIITSSNLTYSAFYRNQEIAVAIRDQQAVHESLSFFEGLRKRAAPLTLKALDTFCSSMIQIPIFTSTQADSSSIGQSDNATDDLPIVIDADVLAALDNQIGDNLESSLDRGFLAISSIETETPKLGPTEHEFVENLQKHLFQCFGAPNPTPKDIIDIFAHGSAQSHITSSQFDSDRSERLFLHGKLAWSLFVTESIIRDSGVRASAAGVATKAAHVTSSNFVVQQFELLGIAWAITGPGIKLDGDANARAKTRIIQQCALRLFGWLLSSRSWHDFFALLRTMFALNEEFPFESYADHNYKTRLQTTCQMRGWGAPTYKFVSKTGPDHDVTIHAEVLTGSTIRGSGSGYSRKCAEQAAAFDALKSLSRADELERRDSKTVALPQVLLTKCEHDGHRMLLRLTGESFPLSIVPILLIPPGIARFEGTTRREVLAVLGSRVREMLAFEKVVSSGCSPSAYVGAMSSANNAERIMQAVGGTELLTWLHSLALWKGMDGLTSKQTQLDTINAILGALLLQRGLERCRTFAQILFPPLVVQEQSHIAPKSRLQQLVQAALKQPAEVALRWVYKELHTRAQNHKAEFQAQVLLCDELVGQATGKTKKAAAAAAAEVALNNARLNELLNKLSVPSSHPVSGPSSSGSLATPSDG